MNDSMRKQINDLVQQAEGENTMQDLADKAQELADEEGEKFDNLSEALQETPNGRAIEDARDLLEEAAYAFSAAASSMDEATTALADASA